MKDTMEKSLQKIAQEKQEADERLKQAEDEARMAHERVTNVRN